MTAMFSRTFFEIISKKIPGYSCAKVSRHRSVYFPLPPFLIFRSRFQFTFSNAEVAVVPFLNA